MSERRIALQSTEGIYTPGILRWAQNGYAFPNDRKKLRRVFVEGFNLDGELVHRLLSGKVPYEIEGEDVVLTVSADTKVFDKPVSKGKPGK